MPRTDDGLRAERDRLRDELERAREDRDRLRAWLEHVHAITLDGTTRTAAGLALIGEPAPAPQEHHE